MLASLRINVDILLIYLTLYNNFDKASVYNYRYSQVPTGTHRYAPMHRYASMHRYAHLCVPMHKYAQVPTGTHTYAQVQTGTRRYAQMCKFIILLASSQKAFPD